MENWIKRPWVPWLTTPASNEVNEYPLQDIDSLRSFIAPYIDHAPIKWSIFFNLSGMKHCNVNLGNVRV